MVNKDNYEEKVIDLLDGNLEATEVEELLSFLDYNPDLKAEVDMLLPSKLVPPASKYPGIDSLKKEAANLPLSQVAFLSVAALEGNITDEQSADLQYCINNNPAAGEMYTSIQKLRLSPQKVSFSRKNSLKRLSLAGKITRISGAVAAAAAIAILLITTPFQNIPTISTEPLVAENDGIGASTTKNDGDEPAITVTNTVQVANLNQAQEQNNNVTRTIDNQQALTADTEVVAKNLAVQNEIPDSTIQPAQRLAPVAAATIDYLAILETTTFFTNDQTLTQCQVTLPVEEAIDYIDQTVIGKFIAKNFRKNILNHQEVTDSPIKGYEIAEAWIAVLNKMWETDMMLTKNTNQAGELESVAFNSRIINFDTKNKK